MSKRKNHHYVPRFYLKNFSLRGEGKQIKILLRKTGRIIPNASLKGQACRANFYGEDADVETLLCELEGKIAPVLEVIKKTQRIPQQNSEDYKWARFFMLLQNARSKRTVDELNKFIELGIKSIAKYDSSAPDRIQDLRITHKGSWAMSLSTLFENQVSAWGMKLKLLINDTNEPFITSDNPTVKYNQFLERRNHPAAKLGMASKGLQVFCPLTPGLCLILYDERVYRVGPKKQSALLLKLKSDVVSINELVAIWSGDILIGDSKVCDQAMVRYHDVATKWADKIEPSIDEVRKREDPDGSSRISFHQKGAEVLTKLSLSFIRETQHAKSYRMTGYAVELRNEYWRGRIGSAREEQSRTEGTPRANHHRTI